MAAIPIVGLLTLFSLFPPVFFPPLCLPLLFAGTEMFAAVVSLMVAVNSVLFVAIMAKPFYLVPAQPPREIPVVDGNPRPLAVARPVPVAVTEEVVVVPHIEEIIGQPHRYVKAQ